MSEKHRLNSLNRLNGLNSRARAREVWPTRQYQRGADPVGKNGAENGVGVERVGELGGGYPVYCPQPIIVVPSPDGRRWRVSAG